MSAWRAFLQLLLVLAACSGVGPEARAIDAAPVDTTCTEPGGACLNRETTGIPSPGCCTRFCCGTGTAFPGECHQRIGTTCSRPDDCCTNACAGVCCIPQGRYCDGFETNCCEGLSCVSTVNVQMCL